MDPELGLGVHDHHVQVHWWPGERQLRRWSTWPISREKERGEEREQLREERAGREPKLRGIAFMNDTSLVMP